MAELEKEVTRLRATERSLRDAVSNKLLLEEQVHVLSTKVETLQPVQQELHEAKVIYIFKCTQYCIVLYSLSLIFIQYCGHCGAVAPSHN